MLRLMTLLPATPNKSNFSFYVKSPVIKMSRNDESDKLKKAKAYFTILNFPPIWFKDIAYKMSWSAGCGTFFHVEYLELYSQSVAGLASL